MVASELEVVGCHTSRGPRSPTANGSQPEATYEKLMGKPPPVDSSDGAWQWAYTGKKKEAEKLHEIMRIVDLGEQMSLF